MAVTWGVVACSTTSAPMVSAEPVMFRVSTWVPLRSAMETWSSRAPRVPRSATTRKVPTKSGSAATAVRSSVRWPLTTRKTTAAPTDAVVTSVTAVSSRARGAAANRGKDLMHAAPTPSSASWEQSMTPLTIAAARPTFSVEETRAARSQNRKPHPIWAVLPPMSPSELPRRERPQLEVGGAGACLRTSRTRVIAYATRAPHRRSCTR